ncbi:MAG: hypothetical protein H7644_09200 [Candidatus Heimdallarchaeota archaeon]|nr:hypothetical protein [Candidatus Heimdallarchaeota archaeon]MCK5143929.1 hypothetical protein [Candidatus Heimdallarchaeota archaeon]
MSNSDSIKDNLILQRKRYEALGTSLNRSSSMKSAFKVLFATTLIFGLPTVILLSNPLKDNVTIVYQMIIFGFRILIIAMCLLLFSRITSEIYTAKNDSDKKMAELGYKDAKTNTKEERVLLTRTTVYTILKLLVFLATFFGIFLFGSRDNYGYIIGQQVIYVLVLFLLLLSASFWTSRKPDYSPRLGGRLLMLVFVPALLFWGLEVILGFFNVISDSRFHYNTLQVSYGLIYPFAFFFLLVAVIYTSRKTIREKRAIRKARVADFDRRSGFIDEKNIFSQMKYHIQLFFNKMGRTITGREKSEKNIDKKPNKIIVNSMWISIFISFFVFAFILPWNMFPHDGILLVGAAIISYQYSMVKYERNEISVLAVPEKDESIEPPEIRTKELLTTTVRFIMLPTLIFIIVQFILNGIITDGVFTTANIQLILSFTWVIVLIVIPLSIHIFYNLVQNIKEERTMDNIRMYFNGLFFILLFEVALFVMTVVALFGAFYGFGFELIHLVTLALQATFVVVLVILPIIYQFIAVKVKEKGFKILTISTYVLLGLINVGIFSVFLVHILSLFFG